MLGLRVRVIEVMSIGKKFHDEYFTEEFKECNKEFYEQAPMVCEVFEKVY